MLGTNDRTDSSAPGRVVINSTEARTHPEWLTVSNNWIDNDLGVIRSVVQSEETHSLSLLQVTNSCSTDRHNPASLSPNPGGHQ